MELCKGPELLEAIKKSKTLNEQEAANIMQQLVSAVQHLHSNDYVHMDLKPENIMFAEDPPVTIRLMNFAFAQKLDKNLHTAPAPSLTLQYAAPEMIHSNLHTAPEIPFGNSKLEGDQGDRPPIFHCEKSSDMWSLGVILVRLYFNLFINFCFFAKNKI